jgi:hypothetical protein
VSGTRDTGSGRALPSPPPVASRCDPRGAVRSPLRLTRCPNRSAGSARPSSYPRTVVAALYHQNITKPADLRTCER